jgi:hypothetical protein
LYVSAEGLRRAQERADRGEQELDREEEDEEEDNDEQDARLSASRGTIYGWSATSGLRVVAQGFRRPDGVVARSDGTLLVAAERFRNGALRLDGSVFTVSPSGQVGVHLAQSLERPSGLTLDATGALFLSATTRGVGPRGLTGTIVKRRLDGALVDFGTRLDTPRGLALGPDGHLVVADAGSQTVIRYRAPQPPTLQLADNAATNRDPFPLRGTASPQTEILVLGARERAAVLSATGTFEVPVSLRHNQSSALAVYMVAASGNGLASVPAAITVVHDDIAPLIAGTLDPPANGAGWHRTDVGVRYICSDDLSGVVTCPGPVVIATEGAGQKVSASAVDRAGNVAPAVLTLNIDKTAPRIEPIIDPPSNELGWHRTSPAVRFNCVDDLSGIEECTPLPVPQVIGQPAIGFARDRAGNTATVTVPLKVDPDPPTLATTAPADGTTVGTDVVTISGTATDALSGLHRVLCNNTPASLDAANFTCSVRLSDGENLIPVNAFDFAGNTASAQIRVWKLRVTIESPVEGAVLSASPVAVRGTVTDPNARAIAQNVVATVTGTTFEAAGVTLFEGPNELRVRARNLRGGEAVATRSVVLDTVAPVVSITSPADRAIFTAPMASVSAVVTDATPVSCTIAGKQVFVDAGAFIGTATLTVGPNPVTVGCRDAAGHETTKALTVYHDPVPLTVTAVQPANGSIDIPSASTVEVSFNEPVAPASVNANTLFFRIGAALLPAAIATSPDGRSAVLSPVPAFPPGTGVDVIVTTGITDLSGNPLALPFVSRFTTAGAAPNAGVVLGEVYDDTRSLPLEGAVVELLSPQGVSDAAFSDTRGRYLLPQVRADLSVRITKADFTTAVRTITSPAGAFAEVLDARLTPLAPPQRINRLLGATVQDAAGDALVIPPGALPVDSDVRLTPVSSQGPRAVFPPGWAPLGIVEISASAPFNSAATLRMTDRTGRAADRAAVFARFDDAVGLWVAVGSTVIQLNTPAELSGVEGAGQFALLIADNGDRAPVAPAFGQPLTAGEPSGIPESATASGTVTPSVGRSDDPNPAVASVTIAGAVPLRSGTLLRGDFMELFVLRDGGRVVPLDTSQDLIAYRSPLDDRTLAANFPIAPSKLFALPELSEGSVTVTLLRRPVIKRNLIGRDGGGVQTDDGSRVFVPPNALTSSVPIELRRLESATFPVPPPSGTTFLGGLEVDVSVQSAAPLTLTLAGVASLVPTGSEVVIAEARVVDGRTRLLFVAPGRVDGDAVTTVSTVGVQPLPGARGSGRYGFYRIDRPLALVTGTAQDEEHRLVGHMAELASMPFVSLTDAAGRFALVSPPGSFVLSVTGAFVHDQVSIEGTTGTAPLDVIIRATPPRVETVTVRLPRTQGNLAGPVVLVGEPAPQIDDDDQDGTIGNGNGVVEAGERVGVKLSVRNDGTVPVTGGFVTLRIRSPGQSIDVQPATIPVGTLLPDVPTTFGPFVFELPPTFDPANVRYTFAYLTAGGVSNSVTFPLPLGVEHFNVPVGSEITIRFSEPVQAAGLENAITLARESGEPVGTRLLLSDDATVATLRAETQLAQESVYRLTLAPTIVDRDKRSLFGAPVVKRITTQDRRPPAAIAAGDVEASIPDNAGFVTITGSPTAVKPDDIVIFLNERTGFTATVTPNANGSFSGKVRAEVTDQITILVRDVSGNETRVNPGPYVRRDPVTGEVLSVVLGREGGAVPGRDGLRLIVPAGALSAATELSVQRTSEPFQLPPDIVADSKLAAAFTSAFKVVGRVRVQSDSARFDRAIRLALPAPFGAQPGDRFVVARTRSVKIGGPIADLDLLTGVPTAENPTRTVDQLEIVDTATVKVENGVAVLSTDSPPFQGITGPATLTMLSTTEPLLFFSGEVRVDSASGALVPDAIVRTLPDVDLTSAFAAVTDSQGHFVVGHPSLGAPPPQGSTVSSRLDVFDPVRVRTIRRDVRAVIGVPAPPDAVVAHLVEPFVLPTTLPPAIIDVVGDLEPPTVDIQIEGPSFQSGFTRVGDPLTVRVVATDNDRVDFIGLEADQGDGFLSVAAGPDGMFGFTPLTEAVITFRARAVDPHRNSTFADEIIRSVAGGSGAPLIPGPLPSPPVPLGHGNLDAPPDGHIKVPVSEPLDPASVSKDTVQLLDPDGAPIDVTVSLNPDATVISVDPLQYLKLGALYKLVLSTVKDLQGASLKPTVLTFSTPTPRHYIYGSVIRKDVEDIVLLPPDVTTVTIPDGSAVRLMGVISEASGTCPVREIKVNRADISIDASAQFVIGSCVDLSTPNAVDISATRDADGNLRARQITVRRDTIAAVRPTSETSDPRGHLEIFEVRPSGWSAIGSARTTGRPLSLTVDNKVVYVANRFLGAIATTNFMVTPFLLNGRTTSLPDVVLGCFPFFFIPLVPIDPIVCHGLLSVIKDLPEPPSNVEGFEVGDQMKVTTVGPSFLNFVPALSGNVQGVTTWNPNTWPARIGVTGQGIAVLNFNDNIELFTPVFRPDPTDTARRPESIDVVGPVRGVGQISGRCQGGSRDRALCLITATSNGGCDKGSCAASNEYFDAVFFDDFAATLDGDGLRIVATDVPAPDATLSRIDLPDVDGARLGAVRKAAADGLTHDLVVIARRSASIAIIDVADRFAPKVVYLSTAVNDGLRAYGMISVDSCRRLAYIASPTGEFHMIDFSVPGNPRELNDPGPGKTRFRLPELGTRLRFNGIANRDGRLFIAGDAGIAFVDIGPLPSFRACVSIEPNPVVLSKGATAEIKAVAENAGGVWLGAWTPTTGSPIANVSSITDVDNVSTAIVQGNSVGSVTISSKSYHLPGVAAGSNAKSDVKVFEIIQHGELWDFCDERVPQRVRDPATGKPVVKSTILTEARLEVIGPASGGVYKWEVTEGFENVGLVDGSGNLVRELPPSAERTVTLSSRYEDHIPGGQAKVRATYFVGTSVASSVLVVNLHYPKEVVFVAETASCDPRLLQEGGTCTACFLDQDVLHCPLNVGYWSRFKFQILDDLGKPILDGKRQGSVVSLVPVNERLGPKVNVDANNWAIIGDAGFIADPDGIFFDRNTSPSGVYWNPPVENPPQPPQPLGQREVYRSDQEIFVGSERSGRGCPVLTNTIRKFRDHAAHCGGPAFQACPRP